MNGKDVKTLLRNKQIRQWQLALELNVSESTLVRWLRGSLNKEREQAIRNAIDKLIIGNDGAESDNNRK